MPYLYFLLKWEQRNIRDKNSQGQTGEEKVHRRAQGGAEDNGDHDKQIASNRDQVDNQKEHKQNPLHLGVLWEFQHEKLRDISWTIHESWAATRTWVKRFTKKKLLLPLIRHFKNKKWGNSMCNTIKPNPESQSKNIHIIFCTSNQWFSQSTKLNHRQNNSAKYYTSCFVTIRINSHFFRLIFSRSLL